MIYSIESQTERLNALEYLADYFGGFLLCDHVGQHSILHECREIEVVASPGMPEQHDFRYGWGGKAFAAMDWLVNEIVGYLQLEPTNLAVIEDPCGAPSDPGLTSGAAGPAWFYQNRVLWPITQDMAKVDLVRQSLLWGLSGNRKVVAFCKSAESNRSFSKNLVLSDDVLFELCNTITCLVTDVFDGEGFMVWKKLVRTQPSTVGGLWMK